MIGTAPLRTAPWWLQLSVPIAILGTATSVAGIVVDRVYAHETASWQSQAIGQDVANLVVLPVMLVLGYAAARGSTGAQLAWAGTVVATAYAFVIYAFAVHFGPLFLAYVAELGLSAWALAGFFRSVDPERTAEAGGRASRFAATFLVAVAGGFALMWVGQDLPAMIRGTASPELRDAGLLTNPVHVLDLALFLPAAVVAGVLLRRRRRWGFVLAPVLLSAMAGISLGIVSLMVVAVVRDQDASLVVALVVGLLGVVEALTCRRLLAGSAAAERRA